MPLSKKRKDAASSSTSERKDAGISEGKKKVKTNNIDEFGKTYQKIRISDDGNCFFRAVLYNLIQDDSKHSECRQLVCDYVDTHADSFDSFFPDDRRGLRKHLRDMRQLREFGTYVEAVAASKALHFNCKITKSNSVELYEGGDIFNNASWPTVYFEYENSIHFNVLIKRD